MELQGPFLNPAKKPLQELHKSLQNPFRTVQEPSQKLPRIPYPYKPQT